MKHEVNPVCWRIMLAHLMTRGAKFQIFMKGTTQMGVHEMRDEKSGERNAQRTIEERCEKRDKSRGKWKRKLRKLRKSYEKSRVRICVRYINPCNFCLVVSYIVLLAGLLLCPNVPSLIWQIFKKKKFPFSIDSWLYTFIAFSINSKNWNSVGSTNHLLYNHFWNVFLGHFLWLLILIGWMENSIWCNCYLQFEFFYLYEIYISIIKQILYCGALNPAYLKFRA